MHAVSHTLLDIQTHLIQPGTQLNLLMALYTVATPFCFVGRADSRHWRWRRPHPRFPRFRLICHQGLQFLDLLLQFGELLGFQGSPLSLHRIHRQVGICPPTSCSRRSKRRPRHLRILNTSRSWVREPWLRQPRIWRSGWALLSLWRSWHLAGALKLRCHAWWDVIVLHSRLGSTEID